MSQHGCPTDEQLRNLVTRPALSDAQQWIADHLDSCESCRQRLEQLVEPLAAPRGIEAATMETPDSLALRQVIRQLSDHMSAGTKISIGKTEPMVEQAFAMFPFLRPSSRSASLGRLGKYEILELIGRGGMGVVFKAIDPTLQRIVAIKVLHAALIDTQEARDRFQREARSIAAVEHERIVAIHHVDQSDGIPFLVMEHVAGESLAERIERQGPLPLEDVIRIGIQTSDALEAAHQRGLIHRDIKPANILLEGAPANVKVTDFGLAKMRDDDQKITTTGVLAGTPEFMSPEQAGEAPLDARSDLFSLGSVLYLACTGVSPFTAPTSLTTIQRIRDHEPPRVCRLAPMVPRWFGAIVAHLLDKDPDHRIQSAAQLRELLQNRCPPTITTPMRVARRARHAWSRSRHMAIPAGLLTILVLVTMALLRVTGSGPQSASLLPARAPPPKQPIVIMGKPGSFDSLSQAIQAASDDDIIEVAGGSYLLEPLRIDSKRLTIRAAKGVPTFSSKSPESPDLEPLLTTNADLRLEGIEIRWSNVSRRAQMSEDSDDSMIRSALAVSAARLTLVNCRIIVGRMNRCFVADGGSVELIDCHLVAPSGAAVFWRPAAQTALTIRGCVLQGANCVALNLADSAAESELVAVRLDRNTLVGQCGLLLMLNMGRNQKVRVEATDNLAACSQWVQISALRFFPRQKRIRTSTEVRGLGRRLLDWSGSGNVYDANMHFLACRFPYRTGTLIPADLNGLAGWCEYWNAGESGSRAVKLEVDQAADGTDSGPPVIHPAAGESTWPADVGALEEAVGPIGALPQREAKPSPRRRQQPDRRRRATGSAR